MKSFFKKIALVLALAMVVTMLPAKAVSAADAEGPQLSRQVKLYIGGDKSGSYSETAYAKVWNKSGYTVQFSSSDEAVATVGRNKGLVTAVSVGEAEITAVFTNEDGKTVTKTCPVVVKKNAVTAGISDASAKALEEGIAAGTPYQPKVFRTSADGETSWKGKDVITDGARFTSSNPDVFTVTKTTGKITAVAAGEATLTVWAVQSEKPEKDEDGKVVEYLATTEKVEYTVKVVSGGLVSAKQTTYNTVAITCDTETVASEIAKDVTKLKSVYVIGENEITAVVKSAAVDSKDAKVVNVTLYNDLQKDVVYKFAYGDGEAVTVVGADLEAVDHIMIVTTNVEVNKEMPIKVNFYDNNGIEIRPGSNYLYFTADDSVDYMIANDSIIFWEIGKQATVTAHYNMGYDKDGKALDDLTHTAVIISSAPETLGDMLGWASDEPGKKASGLGYGMDVINLAAGDAARQLYIKFKNTEFGGKVTDKFNESSDANQKTNDVYEYASTNDNIVMVDTASGVFYPVAQGSAQIIVYKVVGNSKLPVCVVPVNVAANRSIVSLSATVNKSLLSFGTVEEDSIELRVLSKDQLGGNIVIPANVTIVSDVDGIVTWTKRANDDNGTLIYDIKAISGTAKQIRLTITSKDAQGASRTQSVVIRVKTPVTVDRYVLSVGRDQIDLNFPNHNSWEGIDVYHSSINLNAYDRDGYWMANQAMTLTTKSAIDTQKKDKTGLEDGFYYTVVKGTSNAAKYVDGNTFKAVTGSAEVYKLTDRGYDTNTLGNGTYTVSAYQVVEGKVQSLGSKNIIVRDTTVLPSVVVDKNRVVNGSYAASLQKNLTFKRNGNNIDLVISTVDYTPNVDSNNMVKTIFVKSVRVTETYKWPSLGAEYTYTYTIPVGKTFYVD